MHDVPVSSKSWARPHRKDVIISVVAVIAGMAVVALILIQSSRSQPTSAATGAATVPASTSPSTSAAAEFSPTSLGAALKQPSAYTITILGDSTGNDPGEWVYLMAQRISDSYARPVVIHNWSVDSNSYVSETTVGAGNNAPVTIWNGSAPGKNTSYTLDNLSTLAPEKANLTIISHGHNESDPDHLIQGERKIISTLRAKSFATDVVVIAQNPRDDSPDRAAAQQQGVAQIKQVFGPGNEYGVAVIDVNSAFSAQPDLVALLRDDHFHPNASGEQVWANTVIDAFGLK